MTGDFTDKKLLEKVLPTGVFLVQNLVYQDEHFPANVGEYRGQLVLFLDAMNNLKTEINFHPVTCKFKLSMIIYYSFYVGKFNLISFS